MQRLCCRKMYTYIWDVKPPLENKQDNFLRQTKYSQVKLPLIFYRSAITIKQQQISLTWCKHGRSWWHWCAWLPLKIHFQVLAVQDWIKNTEKITVICEMSLKMWSQPISSATFLSWFLHFSASLLSFFSPLLWIHSFFLVNTLAASVLSLSLFPSQPNQGQESRSIEAMPSQHSCT